MPDFDAVSREHVCKALAEYEDLGADAFLSRYGFGRAREYLLRYDGKSYDSKAVLGAAHKYATGTAAAASEFSGGRTGAAKILRALGFEVVAADHADHPDAPATGTWREAAEAGSETAREAWSEAAREVLLEAAGRYRSVVTYKELAYQVQYRTGIRTGQLMHYWIGDVLGRVSADCARRGEPLLSSLCVNAEGSVGAGYAPAAGDAYGETPGDPDDHAARERLECHRRFNASDLPPDGGSPAPVRVRVERKARERPVATCPTCHMQLPATGICDECA